MSGALDRTPDVDLRRTPTFFLDFFHAVNIPAEENAVCITSRLFSHITLAGDLHF